MAARAAARRLGEEGVAFRWNRLIAQRAQKDPAAALPLYKSMRVRSVPPNNHTFPSVLRACAALRDPFNPAQLHAHLTRLGLLHPHRHASAALVDAYGKCGLPDHALRLFEEIPQKDLDPFIWTVLINSLAVNGLTPQAFEAFSRMRRSDDPQCCSGDVVTLTALVSASESLLCGQMLHALIIRRGFDANVRLVNTLVHMYARCQATDDAWDCFRCIPPDMKDVVSWNTVITGLAMNGKNEDALSLFDEMVTFGEAPNRVTLISVVKCCAQLGCGQTAHHIHEYIVSHHPQLLNDVVLMTALVDMHARCGDLERARQVFDGTEGKNAVSWSAMVAGYEQASMPEEALLVFKGMLAEEGIRPNAVTMLSVIAACAALGASRPGRMVHKYVVSAGIEDDTRVFSGLIDMYAKCGDLHLARRLFRGTGHVEKSVISWTAMIGAEGLHGEGRRALSLFAEMQEQGFKPNEVTLVSLLSACSHTGLVEEGMSCFGNMERDHGITPNPKHYSCAVDLLGRAGKLDEAYDLICNMPTDADLAVWGSLLGACRIHGNSNLGELIEDRILSLNPQSAGYRVLLANMYGRAGRWEDVVRVRVALRNDRVRKAAGCTFIEIGNKVYSFMAEDRSHEHSELIYSELHALDIRVRNAGYVKESSVIANHRDAKEVALADVQASSGYHSERLAIAFWVLMNDRGRIRGGTEPIRITKNLRVCEDCHVYTKFVSKVIKRELIVRDSHRFHHFKDGICSCGDYW
ncbi:hypothetical protein Taro_051931 [Colocasia esculenta]|uniref:DYW domain-containing protein n=1 Tax=Colocasia esculenta TaxID=4460 RepID=A0A843XII0_COLES|nr:hypothetical protein [Colocasia esculenta]